jgi:myo-inositol catabolism protein IolC
LAVRHIVILGLDIGALGEELVDDFELAAFRSSVKGGLTRLGEGSGRAVAQR